MARNRRLLGLIGLMVLLVIMISGCAKNQPGQDKPEKLTESNFKTVVLTVEGIT